MKKLFFLILFFSINLLFSQNTYVPDDNFEQFLINQGYDSGSLDNYVPTQNINSLTELHIYDNDGIAWEIESLQGIKDFIALEKLTLDINEVVSIDLSSNTKLKELIINSDALLENLNITNNLDLEVFYCLVTSLPNIDLSNNKKIKDLVIGNSSIIDLDLSKNTQLEKVNVGHGIIQNINLKNGRNTSITNFYAIDQPDLQCIRVDNASYSITNWTQIDDNSVFSKTCGGFQQLTYVPDDNFEQKLIELGYDSGPLDDYVPTNNINTVENLSVFSSNIEDLTGIQDFTALRNLYVNNNKLTVLDVSNNLNLSSVSCGNNNISSLILPDNIEYVYCNHNNLSSLNLSDKNLLFDIICSDNPLTEIKLPANDRLDGVHVNSTLISELDLRNQSNLISHPASFLMIQDNPTLTCVFVDDVERFNTDAWDSITKDSHTTFVANEAECVALSCTIEVDEIDNQEVCDSYTLPNLTNGQYFTQPDGKGNQLNTSDVIISSQTIYIYNIDPITSCFKESSFNITIHQNPDVDILQNVESCNNYTLPTLTNGQYFTQPNGNGNQLNVGDIITSSQTIYIFNQNSSFASCTNESSFDVTIYSTPIVDTFSDIVSDNLYQLPVLVNGSYYTLPNGQGDLLSSGDNIKTSQIIYIFNENGNCSNQSSFTVTINIKNELIKVPPFFTPNNDGINDLWILPSVEKIEDVKIYDRFGKILANPKLELGWDGTYDGNKLNPNSYWYLITLKNGEILTGSVAIKY